MTPGTIIAAGYYLTESERKRLAKQIDAEIGRAKHAKRAAIANAKQEERT